MTSSAQFELPPIDSGLIYTNAAKASAFQRAATQIELPLSGKVVHHIDRGRPSWQGGENKRKKVQAVAGGSVEVAAYTLARLTTVPTQLAKSQNTLSNAIYTQIPTEVANEFDLTVAGVDGATTPGEKFDSLAGAAEVEVTDHRSLVAAVRDAHSGGARPTAFVVSSGLDYELRMITDGNGKPLLNLEAGTLLGLPYYVFDSFTPVGFVGAFNRMVWGRSGEVDVNIDPSAVYTDDEGVVHSGWQQNFVGIRAETEFGNRYLSISEFRKMVPGAIGGE